MVLAQKELKKAYIGAVEIKNIYVWTERVRPPFEEYVLLSDGGGVNKYSELTLNWVQSVRNNNTNWLWFIQEVDKFWIHYKQFDKKIKWFKIVMETTNNNYDNMKVWLAPNASQINTANVRLVNNGFEIGQSSKQYQWNNTGSFWLTEHVNWTYTEKFVQNKSSATARGTWIGKLVNWVWKIDVTMSSGESYSYNYTPTDGIWDMYMIGFQGARWYTGNTGYFIEAKVEL